MNKFIKIFIFGLLCIYFGAQHVLAAEKGDTVISKSSHSVDAFNPNEKTNPKGACYPGFRGGGQLVIYTKDFGESTGTNEYGLEAIIKKGFVDEITGNNAYIPQDGFVISGHGSAKNWIKDNLKEGAKVTFYPDKKIVESVITPDSFVIKAQKKLDRVKKLVYQTEIEKNSNKEKIFSLLSNSDFEINKANKSIDKKDYDNAKKHASLAETEANKALYYTLPYKKDEFKGVWHRPVEKNREAIASTLNKIQKAGINNVFLETYYHGYTIYPSYVMNKYGFTEQRQEFSGFDPLKIWVEEAHKRNMKVNVWFQTFYCGGQDLSSNPKHILNIKPQWANVQQRNYLSEVPRPSTAEHNGYFLDPANPEAKTFLKELIIELTSRYDIDGLNIDYIRYPLGLTPKFPQYVESSWGYSQYARAEFKELYGVDPVCLTPDSELWNKWVEYRQNQVTCFLKDVQYLIKDKNILLSAVIFPDKAETKIIKLQNWEEWLQNGYIDAVTPLILGSSDELATKYVRELKASAGNRVKIYAGLFEPFTNEGADKLLYQIYAVRKENADGVILFDNAHLTNEYLEALSEQVFKKN